MWYVRVGEKENQEKKSKKKGTRREKMTVVSETVNCELKTVNPFMRVFVGVIRKISVIRVICVTPRPPKRLPAMDFRG